MTGYRARRRWPLEEHLDREDRRRIAARRWRLLGWSVAVYGAVVNMLAIYGVYRWFAR